ncbi:hypothetical protein [Nitrospira sp. Nam74]
MWHTFMQLMHRISEHRVARLMIAHGLRARMVGK